MMDASLKPLCDSLKKVILQLKPAQNPWSFVLVVGKASQGKSALLKQSGLKVITFLENDFPKIYYNDTGIFLEISESWLNQQAYLLAHTLKQLNQCVKGFKITGLLLCVDINTLLLSDPDAINTQKETYIQLTKRFTDSLGYRVHAALIITKMDAIAGFSEFYQGDHEAELVKPVGFSLPNITKKDLFTQRFNDFLESINQQVIHKMHPARSTIKRTLIREFPLQLTSVRVPLQSLIQGLNTLPLNLHAVYFTSAEQGGVSVDRLNLKIQQEYALIVQDVFPQATNYKAYFIKGALTSVQSHMLDAPIANNRMPTVIISIVSILTVLSLTTLGLHHLKLNHRLDEAMRTLKDYEAVAKTNTSSEEALYQLVKATNILNTLSSNRWSLPSVYALQTEIRSKAKSQLHETYLPALAHMLEDVLKNPQETPLARYKALKVYIMLGNPQYYHAETVHLWFNEAFKKRNLVSQDKQQELLTHALKEQKAAFPIQLQLVRDTRNYLNALPMRYFYYTAAKEYFSKESTPLLLDGFALSPKSLPIYYTKAGFEEVISQLNEISQTLKAENWILARTDISELSGLLTQAYCDDYITFWKTFLKNAHPLNYTSFEQGLASIRKLQKAKTVESLLTLVQQNTQPELSAQNNLFNQTISGEFTDIHLMNQASIRELALILNDLEKYLATLSAVHDGGKTAFNLTKMRFMTENSKDPISLLFSQARQLPEPFTQWTTQIAEDTWGLLIKESRTYINQQWRDTVYRDYQNSIAFRYPLDASQIDEIQLNDFNRFFSQKGELNSFVATFLKPFINTTTADWKPKEKNGYVLPISAHMMNELIRANIITNMFFPNHIEQANIQFTLQKINLDPVIANLQLDVGGTILKDNQNSDSLIHFTWPKANYAKLSLKAIDGNQYEISEQGVWALFKLLEKVNVLVDNEDSTNLQILFEVNSNSGRYLLTTDNQVNPFAPGVLNGFKLSDSVV